MAKEILADSYDESLVQTLSSPQAIAEYFRTLGVDITDNEADGIYSLDIVEKKSLVGIPFIATAWSFRTEGTYGEFVSVEYMRTDNGARGVFNDGSTGIRQQLHELTEYRTAHNHPTPQAGRFVKNGLRVSQYEYTDETTGKMTPAETFYLAW